MIRYLEQKTIVATLDEFIHYCRFERKLDEKTIRAYRFDIKQFADNLMENAKWSDVTRDYLKQWIELLSKYKYKTIKNAAYRFLSVRNKAIIELLFGSGMRIGELCGLQNKDVDLQLGQVRIIGKANKERIVDICLPVILNSLRQWLEVRKSTDGPSGSFFYQPYW